MKAPSKRPMAFLNKTWEKVRLFQMTEKDLSQLEMWSQRSTRKIASCIRRDWKTSWPPRGWVLILQVRSLSARTLIIIWCQFWKIGNSPMTHFQINQIQNLASKIKIQIIKLQTWRMVPAENCNCQTSEAFNSTPIHTHIQTLQSKKSTTKCLTWISNLKSMKILSQERQPNILRMVKTSTSMNHSLEWLQLIHVCNIKGAVLWCNLNTMVISSMDARRIFRNHQINTIMTMPDCKTALPVKYRYNTYSKHAQITKMSQFWRSHRFRRFLKSRKTNWKHSTRKLIHQAQQMPIILRPLGLRNAW